MKGVEITIHFPGDRVVRPKGQFPAGFPLAHLPGATEAQHIVININNSETAIVGKAYDEPKKLVVKYSKKNIPLLFLGKTGSGKELFAKLYMEKSKREGKKMTTNCAAVSKGLLESEVFGHEIGAFTGAHIKRSGLIQTCENGILFLDELDSASPEFQASISRVTEQNTFRPVGSVANVLSSTKRKTQSPTILC